MIFLELLCSGVMKAGSLEDHSFSHFQAHSALEDNFHISFKWTSMESWSCVSVSAEMVWKTHITASATSAPSYLHGKNLCKDGWPSWMPPSQTRFSSSFKSQLLHRLEASFPTLGDKKGGAVVHSSPGLASVAAGHAGMKLHSSTSLLSNSSTAGGATWTVMEQLSCNHVEIHPPLFCSVPSHTHTHTPLALLCSILCLHLLQRLCRISPPQLFFLLSAGRRHINGLLSLKTMPSSPPPSPSVYQFLLLLLAVSARGGRAVVLLWLQFGHKF